MNTLNASVLMSNANYLDNQQQINPYYSDVPIDVHKAQTEHESIQSLLRLGGTTVSLVDAPATSQDGVYTANWALIRGDTAILARLPEARRTEEMWAEQILRALGKQVLHIPEDWHFSGQGDALPCGNLLFCGQGYRSDVRAQAWAADTLGYERIQLQTVPERDAHGNPVNNQVSGWADSFYYDIDLALSVLKVPSSQSKGLIAYCPNAFTKESQDTLARLDTVDTIIVSEQEAKEAFACNLVSNGTHVVMSASAPLLKAAIEAHGLTVSTPEITELSKGGGYIRCTTLSFND